MRGTRTYDWMSHTCEVPRRTLVSSRPSGFGSLQVFSFGSALHQWSLIVPPLGQVCRAHRRATSCRCGSNLVPLVGNEVVQDGHVRTLRSQQWRDHRFEVPQQSWHLTSWCTILVKQCTTYLFWPSHNVFDKEDVHCVNLRKVSLTVLDEEVVEFLLRLNLFHHLIDVDSLDSVSLLVHVLGCVTKVNVLC